MRLFTALILILMTAPAMAASFDCAKASHKLEHLVCSDAQVSSQDEQLNKMYRAALDRVFDKQGLRNSQAEWQRKLRTQCAGPGCTVPDLEHAYDDRIFFLQNVNEEIFEANYKTNDVAILKIYHIDGQALDIGLTRTYLDAKETDKPLCRMPASDDDPGVVAKMQGNNEATWSDGACTLNFVFRHDAKGSVVSIDVDETEACKKYCTDGFYPGDTNFIPANDWTSDQWTSD